MLGERTVEQNQDEKSLQVHLYFTDRYAAGPK